MKKVYILVVLLLTLQVAKAQLVEVVGVAKPAALAINGDELFIAESIGSNKISKININEANPVVTDVVDLGLPYGLELIENDLYISEITSKKVSKIDISEANPTPIDIVTGLDEPFGLVVKDNFLYVVDNNAGKILRKNLDEESTTFQEYVVSIDDPSAILIHGEDLYFTSRSGGIIHKKNITSSSAPTTFYEGLQDPVALAIKGNYLYVAEISAGKVVKIDITTTSPTITTVIPSGEISGPSALAFHNDDLYIADFISNRIFKFTEESLAVNNKELNQLEVYPKPASEYIQVKNLNDSREYKIYNSIGKKVKEGITSKNQKINIKDLASGVYFLKIEKENAIKFIKK